MAGAKHSYRLSFPVLLFLAALTAPVASSQSSQSSSSDPLLLQTMGEELARAKTLLSKSDPPAHFISYLVDENPVRVIGGSNGAIVDNIARHERRTDISVRVGSPDLDNTHGENHDKALFQTDVPVDDRPDAIARVLWLNTSRSYQRAALDYRELRSKAKTPAQSDDLLPDFSTEKAQVFISKARELPTFNQHEWEDKIRRFSAIFNKHPEIERSTVMLVVDAPTRYFVSSEGSRIVASRPLVRVFVLGSTHAVDGMELARSETFAASSFDKLVSDQEIAVRIEKLAADLRNLKNAPVVQSFSGPALLSARAAAVIFHEIVGHRLEGQGQRLEKDQTFVGMVNQAVLPTFLSVEDDPALATLDGNDLSGTYQFDEEGQKGERVQLISNGILRQLLMSRTPVKGFMRSNGHGRAQAGMMPVARQGNLIVHSSNSVPDSELRARLIQEIKRQNKPYGLYFEDIAGGFTQNFPNLPDAFSIMPLMVWKVYPDGRSDELIRGADIVGIAEALNYIVMTGEKLATVNGECKAESGSLPVSASAPAMLFTEIRVREVVHGQDRPPLLPPPDFDVRLAPQGGTL